jgi:YesN/AraC family two-component response regulator
MCEAAVVPDLLITDVAMPGLSGIELAIHVQMICPDCKVLLFSGQAETVNLFETARSEGHDFELLLKPVHPIDLLKKIERTFDFTSRADLACPHSPKRRQVGSGEYDESPT